MSDVMALLGKLAMVQRLYSRHKFECRYCSIMEIDCAKRLELEFAGMAIEAEFGEMVRR